LNFDSLIECGFERGGFENTGVCFESLVVIGPGDFDICALYQFLLGSKLDILIRMKYMILKRNEIITLMIADLILNVTSMFLVVNSDREFILSTKVYVLNYFNIYQFQLGLYIFKTH